MVPVSLAIFLKLFFALKVNIYLQNMSIKRRLARFDQKTCIFVVLFVCLFVGFFCNITDVYIFYAYQLAIFQPLQHEFELSTLLSISSNGHVDGLC